MMGRGDVPVPRNATEAADLYDVTGETWDVVAFGAVYDAAEDSSLAYHCRCLYMPSHAEVLALIHEYATREGLLDILSMDTGYLRDLFRLFPNHLFDPVCVPIWCMACGHSYEIPVRFPCHNTQARCAACSFCLTPKIEWYAVQHNRLRARWAPMTAFP